MPDLPAEKYWMISAPETSVKNINNNLYPMLG